jgi:regulator of RNase E activity RraA
MKTYVKTIEAEQFTGDIQTIADFAGEGNKVLSEDGKVTLVTETTTWNISKGDYVVKEYNGVVVFKEPRFLKDYALESKPEAKEDKSFMDKVKSGTHMPSAELQGNKDLASTKPKTDKPEEK